MRGRSGRRWMERFRCAFRRLGETERGDRLSARQPDLRQRMSAHSLERIRSYSPEACAEGMAAAIAGGKEVR